MIQINATALGKDIKGVRSSLERTKRAWMSKETLLAAGQEVTRLIRKRVSMGKTVTGAAMKPYSAKWLKKRVAAGRGKTPDLTFTGRMMGNLDGAYDSPGKGHVGFTRDIENSKAAGNDNLRPFMGMEQESELARVNRVVEAQVEKLLRDEGFY